MNGPENIVGYIERVVPQARALLAAGTTIGVAEVALVILAVLRWRAARSESRRVGRWPELLAAAGPIVLLAAAAWSIHTARSHFGSAMLTDNPADRARLVADCLAGQLNAIPLGILALAPALLLASIAVGFQVSARLRVALPTTLVLSVGFGTAGLGALLAGAYQYAIALIKTLSGMSGVDAEVKSLLLPKGLAEARELYFDRGVSIAVAAVAIVTIASVFLLHRGHAETSQPRRTWLWSGLCFGGAVAAWLVALPMRAENGTPWPNDPQSGTGLAMAAGRTPDLEGIDPLERAPIITVTPDQLLLDGQPEVPMTLAQGLLTLRRNYQIIHPNEPFNGLVDIICPPQTEIRFVRSAIGAIAAARYDAVSFALRKTSSLERPVLGRLQRDRWTAANASLDARHAPEKAEIVEVELERHRDCDALVRTLVATRSAAKWPVVK